MAVTWDNLRELAGASTSDQTELETCLRLAVVWVDKYLADNGVTVATSGSTGTDDVPTEVYDEAVLLVAQDEFGRRRAPNGVLNQQYAGEDGVTNVPIRIGRDPLSAAYAPLGPWIFPVVGGL